MIRENINDLIALAAVAEERSFTKAAARLNVSQSALSHAIKGLEQRLGLRLLTRTTRSVAPTLEGEDLLATLNPCFETIEARLQALNDARDQPTGTVRIVAVEYAIESILWPKLSPVLKAHPAVNVEFVMDYGYTDLASSQCDAGVRYGEQVSEGMISMRIGPDERMICVGAPEYFKAEGTPQEPRRAERSSLHQPPAFDPWRALRLGIRGRRGQRDPRQGLGPDLLQHHQPGAARGARRHGLALVPERLAQPHIESGALRTCLDAYCPSFPGFHLYYPSRQRPSSAFELVLAALRERG